VADIALSGVVRGEVIVAKFGADLDVVLRSALDNIRLHLRVRVARVCYRSNHLGREERL
jgi:hypothetical protein